MTFKTPKWEWGRNVQRRSETSRQGAKRPKAKRAGGEMSRWRNVLGAKRLEYETSWGRNVIVAKRPDSFNMTYNSICRQSLFYK